MQSLLSVLKDSAFLIPAFRFTRKGSLIIPYKARKAATAAWLPSLLQNSEQHRRPRELVAAVPAFFTWSRERVLDFFTSA
ncbi:hypothetical protein TGPRC2_232840 [Toxoplasma gondii TgCatPRC2]|uniref:Uncharacterized protein n=1 Tax=Toxoplasma gondii TgCatPRC2 TaxID=1130821 RepID=A0A151H2I4_TOXGO|nr:hypothetical protein TGPRC2_232840 [Toxoplasma gondii TgCatPRC2]